MADVEYTIDLRDGKTLKVLAPEGASDDQILAAARGTIGQETKRSGKSYADPVLSRLGLGPTPKATLGDSITNDATLGLSDEAAGLAGVAVNAFKAPFSSSVDFRPLDAFNYAQQGASRAIADYRAEHPAAAFGGSLLGSLAALPSGIVGTIAEAPGFLARLAQGAKAGAAAGAVQGAGGSEGPSGRITGGLGGLVGGGLVGSAIPAALGVGAPVAAGVRRLLPGGGNDLPLKRIAEAMLADNLTPVAAGAAMDAAQANGVPSMLADQGENLQRLLGAVGRQPGQGRAMVRDVLRDRQMGSYDRVSGAISRDLGPIDNVNQRSDRLIEQARAAAGPLYDEAYAAPAIGSPALDRILATPSGKVAVGRAHRIAADEMRDPRALGFELDEAGNVVLNPVNAGAFSTQANAKSEFDAAQEAYRTAFRTPGADVNAARDRLLSAREAMQGANAALAGAPSEGVAAVGPQYTPQTIDYVKRGLDDMIEPYRDPVTRRLNLDEGGRAIDALRRGLRTEADTLNPAYGAARKAYEGPAREKDALYQGSQAIHRSAGDLDRQVASMSDSERQQFALGMRSALDDALSRRVDGGDKVGGLLGTPQRREVVKRAAGPDANFDRFAATMDAERKAGDTYRIAMTGSPTAVNLADDALVGDAGIVSDAMDHVIRGGGLIGAATNLLAAPFRSDAAKFGLGRTGDRVRQGIAATLIETDPAAFSRLLDQIGNNNTLDAASRARLGRISTLSGLIGGSSLGSLIGHRPDQFQ